MSVINPATLQFDEDEGIVIAITAGSISEDRFVIGRTYMFAAQGGMALMRWGGGNASAADGGFDFAVPDGGVVIVKCPRTNGEITEGDTSSAATAAVYIARLAEDI